MPAPQFVLASASTARRELLIRAGIQAFTSPSKFDEDSIQIEDPVELSKVLSKNKAQLVAPLFPNALVLGCDSVMALDGVAYGKPESEQEAFDRWRRMRGRTGAVITGHTLITPSGKMLVRSQSTKVFFTYVPDREIEDYIATGEPMNCAGAFTIDGRGSVFIEKIEGCHTNVIGLSMPLLREMLRELGYSITDFWSVG
ncbi:MAG: nucleoside triphosphate pyrophosphatase [Cyanobacteria bacterium J06628_6]